MGSVRVMTCCVAFLMVLGAAGCGSSGSSSTGEASRGGTGAAGSDASKMIPRGIKGEDPTEVALTLHLSAADCKALAELAEARLGKRLTRASTPKPPLSKCRIEGSGIQLNVFLDTGHGANMRYKNRIEETVQFNTEHPSGLPRPVPDVGEKSYEDSSASWIPALGSLLAVRGGRWLTVTISAAGLSDRRLRDEAAVLARAGFKLSATG